MLRARRIGRIVLVAVAIGLALLCAAVVVWRALWQHKHAFYYDTLRALAGEGDTVNYAGRDVEAKIRHMKGSEEINRAIADILKRTKMEPHPQVLSYSDTCTVVEDYGVPLHIARFGPDGFHLIVEIHHSAPLGYHTVVNVCDAVYKNEDYCVDNAAYGQVFALMNEVEPWRHLPVEELFPPVRDAYARFLSGELQPDAGTLPPGLEPQPAVPEGPQDYWLATEGFDRGYDVIFEYLLYNEDRSDCALWSVVFGLEELPDGGWQVCSLEIVDGYCGRTWGGDGLFL